MKIRQAIEFMKKAHYGQLDKSGYEYWYHPLRVMLRLGPNASFEERCAALLHDVLEDTPFTIQDMAEAGIPEISIFTVDRFLTRREGTTYREYIKNIIDRGNTLARRIKISDLADNMSPGRSAKLPEHLKGINIRHLNARKLIRNTFDTIDPDLFKDIVEGDLPNEFMEPFVKDHPVLSLDAKFIKWELLYK